MQENPPKIAGQVVRTHC